MKICPICNNSDLHIKTLCCNSCNVEVGGNLHTSPLARLGKEETELATFLILHGGNLKTLAEELKITYPTLRKRLDNIIEILKGVCDEDESRIDNILNQMEKGEIKGEEGLRIIKEIRYEI